MESETILVVDDSVEFIDIITKILAPMNFTLLTAFDGQSGLQKARDYHPDLILTDLNMPLMNGLELLTLVRQQFHTIPIILMTAYGSEQVILDAFRMGIRDYLTKPFNEEDLKQAIDQALRETRLARERENLAKSLHIAEAVQTTVVTLSHYLNNYLTALNGGLQLLEEKLDHINSDPEFSELLFYTRRESLSIEAVMRVLLKATTIDLAQYTDITPMLDIQNVVEQEIKQLVKKRML